LALDRSDKPGRPAGPRSRTAAIASNVRDLITKRNFPKAIETLKAELQRRRGDERLRVQLADVLVMAGRPKEAVELLNSLADDLALEGQAGKAITALKKIQKFDPGREDIEEKLSYLIKHQSRPAFDPWSRSRQRIAAATASYDAGSAKAPAEPQFGMEEIKDEPAPEMAAAPAADAALSQSAEPSLHELFSDDAARDQLVGMLEEVFTPAAGPVEPIKGDGKLAETPLFRDFSQEELLAVIRGLRLHTFEAGEIIVSAGEPGDSLYVLTTGSVRAYMRDKRGKHVQVREMSDGDFFGEMSIMTGNPRSATITASSYCELLELDKETLNQISKTNPNVRVVLQEFYKKRATHTLEALPGPGA
jgi:hypothetical protein